MFFLKAVMLAQQEGKAVFLKLSNIYGKHLTNAGSYFRIFFWSMRHGSTRPTGNTVMPSIGTDRQLVVTLFLVCLFFSSDSHKI